MLGTKTYGDMFSGEEAELIELIAKKCVVRASQPRWN